MKKLIVKLSLGLMVTGMSSCDDTADGELASLDNTDLTDDFLGVSSMLLELESMGFSEIERQGSSTGAITGRKAGECVDFSVNMDESGRIFYTYDFGEGCEIDSLALSGRVVTSFFIDRERNFEETISYENFSWHEVSIDGEETITGRYVFEFGEDMLDFDIDYSHDRQISVTGCDGTTYGITSNSSVRITRSNKTVSVLDQTIETANSTYVTSVEAPLVQDFTCDQKEINIYTTGVLKTVSGEEELIIDYGEGTCDNWISVTENGNTIESEASELVQYDFCD